LSRVPGFDFRIGGQQRFANDASPLPNVFLPPVERSENQSRPQTGRKNDPSLVRLQLFMEISTVFTRTGPTI
jgi:hypothetical protein